MNDRQREGVTFAGLVLGVQVVDGPPPAGSKVARLVELEERCAAEGVSEAEFRGRANEL